MELADSADAPHQAMRIMKSTSPEYLNLPVPSAPRKFWELLFPLPYRSGPGAQRARSATWIRSCSRA